LKFILRKNNMELRKLKKQAFEEIEKVENPEELEKFKIRYLGRKGKLTAILRSLKDLPEKERKSTGELANKLKQWMKDEIEKKIKIKTVFHATDSYLESSKIDITSPGIKLPKGHLHPITQVLRQVEEIFSSMGFNIIEGPDIETEYYNFDALNIPKEHPAREEMDTFWLKQSAKDRLFARSDLRSKSDLGQKLLLRTHTSPMQARYMEKNNPPFRIIVPGRVFRYEATDASHSHTFYQLEGLMVDKNINVSNFRAVMEEFFKKLFSKNIKVRLRPSYFPFTEPSFEIDIYENKKWVEIIGAGMVHPNVFKAVGYNPANWQGFAFGMGLDRITMMKYKINDIRLLYSGDLRFLKQF